MSAGQFACLLIHADDFHDFKLQLNPGTDIT